MKTFNFKIVCRKSGSSRHINVRAENQKHALSKSKFYLNENETIVY